MFVVSWCERRLDAALGKGVSLRENSVLSEGGEHWAKTDKETALILLLRAESRSERHPNAPRQWEELQRKSHHRSQSQGSLHVFPAARRAIYIVVFNIARKLRTDGLFFSCAVSSPCGGDAGAPHWWLLVGARGGRVSTKKRSKNPFSPYPFCSLGRFAP